MILLSYFSRWRCQPSSSTWLPSLYSYPCWVILQFLECMPPPLTLGSTAGLALINVIVNRSDQMVVPHQGLERYCRFPLALSSLCDAQTAAFSFSLGSQSSPQRMGQAPLPLQMCSGSSQPSHGWVRHSCPTNLSWDWLTSQITGSRVREIFIIYCHWDFTGRLLVGLWQEERSGYPEQ